MSHSSKNWQVIYRYQDSLAGCFVWAPDEAQAEKKFKARKEFEYDPEFDRDPEEGNIRSIYEYVAPQSDVAKKTKVAIDNGFTVLACIGELKEEREMTGQFFLDPICQYLFCESTT